jgi:uncharacterized membrane protein
MAFCNKCGAEMAPDAVFCAKCGQATNPAAQNSEGADGVAASELGENVAGLLCYLGFWVTGLIFLFIDKRPFVRFHAAQSIVVFGGLHIAYIVLGRIFLAGFWLGGFAELSIGGLLLGAVKLLSFVLWILLMIKAYQGQKYRVPVAADLAQSIAHK